MSTLGQLKAGLIVGLDNHLPKVSLTIRAHHQRWRGEPELRLLPLLVPGGAQAIDVGANNGVYTYWLQRYASTVLAIEPNPDCARLLARSVGSRVRVVNAACGDRNGRGRLHIPVRDGRANHYRGTLERPPVKDEYISLATRLVKIDDLGVENAGFIKIDVEGHEQAVLSGATATLEHSRPVILVEVEDRFHQNIPSTVFEFLFERGYTGLFVFDSKLWPIADFDPAIHQSEPPQRGARGPLYANNFIFIHRQHQHRLRALAAKGCAVSLGSLNHTYQGPPCP